MNLIYMHIVYAPAFLAFFLGLGLLRSRSVYIRALAFLVPTSVAALMACVVMVAPDAVENELTDVLKMQCFALSIVVIVLMFVRFVIRPACRALEGRLNRRRRPSVLA